MAKIYEYRDPSRLTGWLSAIVWILIVALVLSTGALVSQYYLLGSFEAGVFADRQAMIAAAQTNDVRVLILSIITGILGLSSGVLFFFWVYRASANIHAMGASELNASPGFAVGAYFIPFLNLVMPPIIMSEIWKASTNARQWSSQKGTVLIAIWWTLQIVVGSAGIGAFLFGKTGKTIPLIQSLTEFLVVFQFVDIGYRLTMVALIRRISRAQIVQHDSAIETANAFS